MSTKTLLIGDLHGCYDEAMSLICKAGITPNDRLIFVGDNVDRGPKTRECVELAMQHESVYGNHEDKLLAAYEGRYDKARLGRHHLHSMSVLEKKHYDYFKQMPKYIRLLEYNMVVVHAGVLPGLKIEEQPEYILVHCQNIDPVNDPPPRTRSYWPSRIPNSNYKFWVNFWDGKETIIYGHTGMDEPLVTPNTIGIDTGCVFGRKLTGYLLPDKVFIQVDSNMKFKGTRKVERFPGYKDTMIYS